MTSEGDRALLLQLARESIGAHLNGGNAPTPAPSDVLDRRGGAFVTINLHGRLRGCIGHIEDSERLGIVIPRCAIAASTSDPRFPPVSSAEFPQLDLEISLLGPLEPMTSPAGIEVGRHGLLVELGAGRGLLLPQVATEWDWDRETFLAQTCRKAGLHPDAWRHGARVRKFDAEVFREKA